MTDYKLKELEERNRDLEASIVSLSTNNSQQLKLGHDSEQEIDIRELWNILWAGKWLIIAITTVFSIGALLYALWIPNEYKSTVLLAPASPGGSSSLSKLAGQFGGLASLAGINLSGGGAEDKSVVAREIIKTWGFLEKFIIVNNIQVEVFAAEGWDRSTNELIINSDLYDVENKKWVRDFDPSKGQKVNPGSWELFEKLKDRISISLNETNGLISLSVEYYSPTIARQWTDKLVKAINAHIQKQDRDVAIKSIAYLNEKIRETNIANMQSVFYQLIEEQTKALMLAEVSDEYVFKTLSPAKVAEEEAKPKRALITLIGLILGVMISFMLLLIRHFRKSEL